MNLTSNNLTVDEAKVKDFVHGRMEAVENGFLCIWCQKGKDGPKRSKFFGPDESDQAALYCADMAKKGWDVYFGQGFLKNPLQSPLRGKESDVVAIICFWFDCDIRGGVHKENPKNLPTEGESKAFFRDEIPFKPSQVIHSGGGLHLYWLFDEPFIIKTENDRAFIKDISSRFQLLIIEKMKSHGWKQDNTSDLVRVLRVLRVPGTFNFKSKPVMVEVI